jgi:hypothetical protein
LGRAKGAGLDDQQGGNLSATAPAAWTGTKH